MKARIIYLDTSNTECDIFMSDGGVASIHHNGEHIITTYYQDRCDSEDEYIWEKLSEGKVYCKDWEGEDKITDEMLEDAVQWLYMGGNTEIIKVPLIKN